MQLGPLSPCRGSAWCHWIGTALNPLPPGYHPALPRMVHLSASAAVVPGVSEGLLSGCCGVLSEAVRRQIYIVRTSGARLLALINDVMDAAALRQHRLVLKPEQLDLRPLVGDVVDLTRSLVSEKGGGGEYSMCCKCVPTREGGRAGLCLGYVVQGPRTTDQAA